jgi:hypothetical protein
MPKSSSMAGLMPGPAQTLTELLVDSPHVPLPPLFACRVIVRIGK